MVLVLGGCVAQPIDSMHHGSSAGDLTVHVVNVGQGSATLIEGPDGTTLLVDGGNKTRAIERLIPYLTAEGVTGFDYVVLTHRDTDHMNGLTELFDQGYDVTGAIWDNGSSKTGTAIQSFLDSAATTTAGSVQAMPVGQVIPLGGGAEAIAVAVHADVLNVGPISASNENDWSVVLLVRYGEFEFIVGGDLGGGDDDVACTGRDHSSANVETPIAQMLSTGGGSLLGADGVEVMVINHHGSHSSTNSDWFSLLNPSVAVIGVGYNAFGHPRSVVVDNVLSAGVACSTAPGALILQTDEGDVGDPDASTTGYVVGDVVIVTDGTADYTISGTGNIWDGSDERGAAGLPVTLALDEATGCTGPADCDDGDLCTADACSAGVCSNVSVICDDGDACTADSCDPATGFCDATAISCDDGNVCTADSCDPATGCGNTPMTCDDGDACTADLCDPVTGCGSAPISCDDGDACTADSCDPVTGCDSAPINCDDGDACTIDGCDPAGGCTHDPDPACSCTVTENPEVSCGDGQDNDCDGFVDAADPDCAPSGPVCGNRICEGNGEDGISCSADCRCAGRNCSNGNCGDGICSGENRNNCPVDCGG